MNSLRSSVALRTLLCDTLAELSSINSTTLPDGATAFESQSDTLWRLDKSAGTVFDALLGSGLLLKPDDGTAARWFAQTTQGSSPYSNSTYLVSAAAVVMTAGQWNYLGSTAATFALSTGDTSAFSLNLTTGEVTYHGPTRQVLVSAKASVLNGAAANSISIHACISRNNDVVAGAGGDYSAKGEQAMVTADVTEQISTERIMQIGPGVTLRLAFRNATNSDDLSVSFYQLCIVPF